MHLFRPFGVIVVVGRGVEIEYIITENHEFCDAFFVKRINDAVFKEHNVVVQRVVPFTDEFDQRITFDIVGKQDFSI